MSRSKGPVLFSGVQLIAILVLTLVVFLIVDLGRRTTAGYYVSQAEKDLQAEIDAEKSLQQDLRARRDYVTSDEFVEKWAREQAHMVRPGDQPMILVTPQMVGMPLPEALPTDAASLSLEPAWHDWWRLFFETTPGTLKAR
jgi:cell division protein FtsB